MRPVAAEEISKLPQRHSSAFWGRPEAHSHMPGLHLLRRTHQNFTDQKAPPECR
jgi:hypothetical protein